MAATTEAIDYRENPAMFRANPLLFVLFLILCFAGVGIVLLGVWYLRSRAERLTIAGDDLEYERGLLTKSRTSLAMGQIRSVQVHQGLWQRFVHIGDISVFTAGDKPELSIKAMPEPRRVQELVKAFNT